MTHVIHPAKLASRLQFHSLGKPSVYPNTFSPTTYSLMAHSSLDFFFLQCRLCVAPRMTPTKHESQRLKEFTYTKAQMSIVDFTKDFSKELEEKFIAVLQSPLLDIPFLSKFHFYEVSSLRHLSSFPDYLLELQIFLFIIENASITQA